MLETEKEEEMEETTCIWMMILLIIVPHHRDCFHPKVAYDKWITKMAATITTPTATKVSTTTMMRREDKMLAQILRTVFSNAATTIEGDTTPV